MRVLAVVSLALALVGVANAYSVVRPLPGHALTVYDRPDGKVVGVVSVDHLGGPLALGVVGTAGRWAAVSTTLLPNGAFGWVDTRGASVSSLEASIVVHLSQRRLEFRRGNRRRTFVVAVGASGSPTPTGRFAVAEKIDGSRFGRLYGCCILGLTAHQPHPPAAWHAGDYYVAIHGGGGQGQAVSAGCLHLPDAALRYLMRNVPLGTPVFIDP